MQEIWKDIQGYEEYYQVSNLGRVKSKERISDCCYNSTRKTKEKIIAHYLEKNGYLSVCLFKYIKLLGVDIIQTFYDYEEQQWGTLLDMNEIEYLKIEPMKEESGK